jgi:hypothetical protein
VRRAHGAALVDLVIGVALLSILALAAGRLALSGTDLVRSQAGSAKAVTGAREVLGALAGDVPSAREISSSRSTLSTVGPDGRVTRYENTDDGLRRMPSEGEPQEWPGMHAEFEVSASGLVEVQLEAERPGERPALTCESAFWASSAPWGRPL